MLEDFKIPIQWTMMMLKPYLAYFWCISMLIGTTASPVVLRKGLGLLEVEAQIGNDRLLGSLAVEEG